MSQIGTGKAPNRLVTMFLRFADWLGNLRRENDDISADAVRIASLELALRQAQIKAMVWQVKAEDLQDKLDAAQPLIETGRKRKAATANYRAKKARAA